MSPQRLDIIDASGAVLGTFTGRLAIARPVDPDHAPFGPDAIPSHVLTVVETVEGLRPMVRLTDGDQVLQVLGRVPISHGLDVGRKRWWLLREKLGGRL